MKAWWKIHDKPRGRWRPLMEFGVHLAPEEKEEWEQLNISSRIDYCFGSLGCIRMKQNNEPGCSGIPEGALIAIFPGELWQENAKKVGTGYRLRYCNCNGDIDWYTKGYISNLNEHWAFRLPWRPGARPDYSDYIETVRDFLRRVLEELERRFIEAQESAPSDEWLLEEEFDSFSWRTLDSGVEVAERKLRVIRR